MPHTSSPVAAQTIDAAAVTDPVATALVVTSIASAALVAAARQARRDPYRQRRVERGTSWHL